MDNKPKDKNAATNLWKRCIEWYLDIEYEDKVTVILVFFTWTMIVVVGLYFIIPKVVIAIGTIIATIGAIIIVVGSILFVIGLPIMVAIAIYKSNRQRSMERKAEYFEQDNA
jgi:hypothetical protein